MNSNGTSQLTRDYAITPQLNSTTISSNQTGLRCNDKKQTGKQHAITLIHSKLLIQTATAIKQREQHQAHVTNNRPGVQQKRAQQPQAAENRSNRPPNIDLTTNYL
jgi:hypothetical protein